MELEGFPPPTLTVQSSLPETKVVGSPPAARQKSIDQIRLSCPSRSMIDCCVLVSQSVTTPL